MKMVLLVLVMMRVGTMRFAFITFMSLVSMMMITEDAVICS